MAPNKFFHNLKQTIRATTRFIPCPVCDQRVRSRGGLTRHLNTVHPDFEDHFAQDPNSTTRKEHQFVYMTNKTYQDENYYDYTNDDDHPTDTNNPSTDDDNNPPYPLHNTPSVFPQSPVHPASPENVHIEDSWLMDVDQDLANENEDTSSLSNITHPTFSDQNNPQANHPNARRQTAPEQKYTKTYHQKLDGKCSLHLYSAILHTESFHRQDLRQGWECAST